MHRARAPPQLPDHKMAGEWVDPRGDSGQRRGVLAAAVWKRGLTRRSVRPKRSVIPDAELCEHARGEPIRVSFAGHGKLNDFQRDKLGHFIVRTHGELERDTHGLKGPMHRLNVLGLESEVVRRGSWHLGAADYGAAPAIPHTTARSAQKCDRHEELKWGTTGVHL